MRKHLLSTATIRTYIIAHLENSDMPLKDFLKAYNVKMRELGDDEVVYQI
jgi:hypothetical protein